MVITTKQMLSAMLVSLALIAPLHAESGAFGPYQLESIATEDRLLVIVRMNQLTGDAWYYDGKNWIHGIDDGELPQSQYVFKVVRYPIKGWALIRMDTVNGKTWTLDNKRWHSVIE